MTRARSWAGSATIAVKTVVVLLAVLQLLQLLGVTRVELARADARAPLPHSPTAAARPATSTTPRPRTVPLGAAAAGALLTPPARLGAVPALGRRIAADAGWTGRQWVCLYTLWQRESTWRPDAQNPTSTAYGVAQFLDRTWPTVGARKTDDPEVQIRAGLRYVRGRYRTPCSAWSFWSAQQPHWY